MSFQQGAVPPRPELRKVLDDIQEHSRTSKTAAASSSLTEGGEENFSSEMMDRRLAALKIGFFAPGMRAAGCLSRFMHEPMNLCWS
jgi:hypothetical protein